MAMSHAIDESTFPHFEKVTPLERGSFAKVYQACCPATDVTVAIKAIPRAGLLDTRHRESFETELKIMESADHPFIVMFYNLIENEDTYFIVMEGCQPDNICKRLISEKRFDSNRTKKYFCQLVSAVLYLHKSLHVIHRDLKLDNLLVDEADNLKVIDFGLSKTLINDETLCDSLCGTEPYLAPEVFRGEYTSKVDVWSMGVCLYLMVFGKFPFNPDHEGLRHEIEKKEPKYPENMDATLKDLLMGMLMKDPRDRMTIEQVARHEWVLSSQYAFYVDRRFFSHEDYSIGETADPEIGRAIEKIGFDREKAFDLGSADAMMYRMLKRKKIVKGVATAKMCQMISPQARTSQELKTVHLSARPIRSLKEKQSILMGLAINRDRDPVIGLMDKGPEIVRPILRRVMPTGTEKFISKTPQMAVNFRFRQHNTSTRL